MNLTERTHANQLKATATTLGLKLPKPVLDAYAKADKLVATVGSFKPDRTLEEVVIAAMLADRDPATDPEVQRIVTAQAIHANQLLGSNITASALVTLVDACRANLEQIVTTLRAPFDEAVNTMGKLADRIGDLSLDDTASIMAKGHDIAEVWAKVKTANDRADMLIAAWTSLMQLTHSVTIDPRNRALRLAAMTHEQWAATSPKAQPWDAMRAGLQLSLPTPQEYRSRVSTIAEALTVAPLVLNRERTAVAGHDIYEVAR